MDPESTGLNEIIQTEKNKYCPSHLHVESQKKKTKQKLIDTENRLVVAQGRGCEVGEMGHNVENSSYEIKVLEA